MQKGTSVTMLREKTALTLGSDDFLFPVLSLSEYKLALLRQKNAERDWSGGAEGKRWPRDLGRG